MGDAIPFARTYPGVARTLAECGLTLTEADWDDGLALLAVHGIAGLHARDELYRFLERISPAGMAAQGILTPSEAAELDMDFPGWLEQARHLKLELQGMDSGEQLAFLLHAYGHDCMGVVNVLLHP